MPPSRYGGAAKIAAYQNKLKALQQKQAALKAQNESLRRQVEAARKPDAPVLPEEHPGLKVHVCTLVAPDSQSPVAGSVQVTPSGQTYPAAKVTQTPGRDWTPVYVHAKLIIVNDTFMTLGSANINTRSMQVDSELNIANDRPEITVPLRRQLWGLHTAGRGAQDKPLEAFKAWADIMKQNKQAEAVGQKPIPSLVEFSRPSAMRTNKD